MSFSVHGYSFLFTSSFLIPSVSFYFRLGNEGQKIRICIIHYLFVAIFLSCVENAHPLAVKLNTLLKEGKIPEGCMYYKFIDNTTSFAMVDSTSAFTFQWDDKV